MSDYWIREQVAETRSKEIMERGSGVCWTEPPNQKDIEETKRHTLYRNGKFYEAVELNPRKPYKRKHMLSISINGKEHDHNRVFTRGTSMDDIANTIDREIEIRKKRRNSQSYEREQEINNINKSLDRIAERYERSGDSHDFIGE